LSDDITIVGDEQLMQNFIRFTAWQNYAATQLAEAEVTEERLDRLVRQLEAEHMVMNWSAAKDKVTLSKAQQSTDAGIVHARREQMEAYAKRKLIQVVVANCERSAAALSRELTRRLGRDPVERRSMRWSP
jgi:hypothetical protein